MTIVEHIQELRSRLVKSVFALLLGTIVGFIWYQVSFTVPSWRLPFTSATVPGFHFPSLGDLLLGPYCKLPPEQRFGDVNDCRLINVGPFDQFMLRLKVAGAAGLVFASPVWLYQIWAYITPGLVRKERRITFGVISAAAFLFVAGAVLAYFVMSYGLTFLLQMGNNVQISLLSGNEYFKFLLGLILVFGVSFELPLFIVMLNMVGVLRYESIKDKRRIIIVLLFIFAAMMTPGGDPYSMVILALILCVLMEIAIQITRLNDRRRSKNRPDWLELDDDQASTLGCSAEHATVTAGSAPMAGSIGEAATPVPAPMPVSAASHPPMAGPVPPPASVSARPTRNSRPAPAMPPQPEAKPDLTQRPNTDFDDVL